MMNVSRYLIYPLVLFFLGCSQNIPHQESHGSIVGEWRTSAEEFKNVRLMFSSDGTMSGYDGCNHFGASYQTDNGILKLSRPMISTMMMCSYQSGIQNFIQHADRFERDGAHMTLTSSNGKKIAFELHKVSFPLARYHVQSLRMDSKLVTPSAMMTLDFSADGKLSGSVGCNRYFSNFTDKDNRLYIAYPAITRMNCEPSVMDQETSLIESLAHVEQYKVLEHSVRLYDANGQTLIEIAKQ